MEWCAQHTLRGPFDPALPEIETSSPQAVSIFQVLVQEGLAVRAGTWRRRGGPSSCLHDLSVLAPLREALLTPSYASSP